MNYIVRLKKRCYLAHHAYNVPISEATPYNSIEEAEKALVKVRREQMFSKATVMPFVYVYFK